MAMTEDRLVEIRDVLACPPLRGRRWWWWSLLLDMMVEHDRLAAEVKRLKPLAAIGQAVEKLPDGKLLKRWYPSRKVRWQITWTEQEIGEVGMTLSEVLTKAGLLKEESDAV